jgi:anionic cell wall polymer biosynthesis LytR-Cps2A-Psr (LCP) family protein
MSDIQKEACKEVIEKLLDKVERQQKVITKIVCYMSSYLGANTVNGLLDELRQKTKTGTTLKDSNTHCNAKGGDR